MSPSSSDQRNASSQYVRLYRKSASARSRLSSYADGAGPNEIQREKAYARPAAPPVRRAPRDWTAPTQESVPTQERAPAHDYALR